MAGELDRDKLLAFLRERREARGVNDSSGLVLSSLYEGLETRIKAGQFDPDPPADPACRCGHPASSHRVRLYECSQRDMCGCQVMKEK